MIQAALVQALSQRPELDAAKDALANDQTSIRLAHNQLEPNLSLQGVYQSNGLGGRRAHEGRALRDDLQGGAVRAALLHRLEEDLMAVDLSAQFGRLRLKNPIATASGTFGYGLEFAEFLDLSTLGAISVKGLSLRPCHGNPPPRICETDAGMLNAIGLQNIGIEAFMAEKLPELHRRKATVIANVWGDTEEDYVAVVESIGNDRRVAAIELNVSCPNVVKGGMIFGNNAELLRGLVARVRAATAQPLIVARDRHYNVHRTLWAPWVSAIRRVGKTAENRAAADTDSPSSSSSFRRPTAQTQRWKRPLPPDISSFDSRIMRSTGTASSRFT